uniref:Nephrin n=1 Tax=Schistocephalus solidus TaxID=70667 RepID=A0A183T096_SCHSO
LIEGDILKLKCEAEDGEPDGTLTWLKATRGGSEYVPIHLLSTAEKDHRQNFLSSQLDIQLKSDDHLSSYACLAMNPGFPANDQRRSEPFHVNITFHPKHIAIQRVQGSAKFTQPNQPTDQERVTTPTVVGETGRLDREGPSLQASPRSIAVVAGEKITLVCRAAPANPPVSLKWRHLSCKPAISPLSADVAATNYSFLSSDSESAAERICSEISHFDDMKSLPFEASRLTSEGQVSLIVQNSHHESIIECSIGGVATKRTFAWHVEDKEDRLKTQTLLNVQFKPNFSNVIDKLSVAVSKYLPQLVVVDGASVDADLTPLSNPPLTSIKWFQRMVESDTINQWLDITSRMMGSFPPEVARFRLSRASVDHMASYKLTATNTIGAADLIFFLNVTHAPRLIGDPVINVTTSAKEAELECRVMANPPPKPSSVYWRRVTDKAVPKLAPLRGDSQQELKEVSSKNPLVSAISDMKCNQELLSRPIKYYVKCFSPEPFYLVSTLIITSVDPSDVGRYECFVDNGIGSPVVRSIDLIYPCKPSIFHSKLLCVTECLL